jgi:predicted Zn finger-like uncharacterized protein
MIAGCPKCRARYRVDADRIGPDGGKLRCTRCSVVFLVRVPRTATATPAPDAKTAASSNPPALTSEHESAAPQPGIGESLHRFDRARLVLLADADEARGKQTAEAIESWGLQVQRVQDGAEAMLGTQRLLPTVVVLDADLPAMKGLQICEVIKRNESLRGTHVVLVGSHALSSADHARGEDHFGADFYIEQADLPDGLESILRSLGLETEGAEPLARTSGADCSTETEDRMREAGETAFSRDAEDEDPKKTEERERARRLARIAVSEMLLYQPEKFEQGMRDENLEQILGLEIREAQALLRQRIGEDVRAETDFVLDELRRVASERSLRD